MCSPCLLCDRREEDKYLCAETCKLLESYQKELDSEYSPIQAISTIEDVGQIYEKDIVRFLKDYNSRDDEYKFAFTAIMR